jgi:hypothetical protein
MPAAQTASRLSDFEHRGAGTDAERRAATWLAGELRSDRRDAVVEVFWCRPGWALAHAWHALLALAGSLLLVSDPVAGGALVLIALASILADAATGRSLGRRLTPERASQNVVSRPPAPEPGDPVGPAADRRVRLIVTANYDAGRTGLVYRERWRAALARCRRLAAGGRLTPGWRGWLVLALVALLAVAGARGAGAAGTPIGIVQLVPTVALVLALALLLELALSEFGPAAGDNAAGAAVAVAVVRALDAAPPRNLDVELVLQGAGDGEMIGLSRHLRTRRRELSWSNTVVLGIGPCGAGAPRWWVSDGALLPLRYHARLCELARCAPALHALPHRGRGAGPALPARRAGLPALTIGCLDERGIAPRSHQPDDTAGMLDRTATDALLEFALVLVDAIDADLARTRPTGRSASDRAAA